MAAAMRKCVVVADDDTDDRRNLSDAFRDTSGTWELLEVADGEALLALLTQRKEGEAPVLVLLDLHMPGMGGMATLRAIKSSEALRKIPVVMLTTSRSDAEVAESYALGANSYVCKPDTYTLLLHMTDGLHAYWMQLVSLPPS